MGFQHYAKIYKKTNDAIPRKCPDRWKDGRMDGRTDGMTDGRMEERTDRPYFIGPFRLPLGVQLRITFTAIFFAFEKDTGVLL